ncbi:alpha/beta fold hydrolase [Kribbella sp. NPDC004875]|uniref:alpha/beta fold hydrolase n=1 Tax=Kribbella sp. NPDC004875 TaxID=3364107 RepID=UPI0036D1FDF4
MTDRVLRAFDALAGGGVTRQELDRGGRKLRWIEGGSGTPVVLEAGAMSPVAGFAAVFQGLVRDHRVIAYDRAGYGMSDPAPLTLDLQVGDLVAVLEEVGPAAVVGHSWGGPRSSRRWCSRCRVRWPPKVVGGIRWCRIRGTICTSTGPTW